MRYPAFSSVTSVRINSRIRAHTVKTRYLLVKKRKRKVARERIEVWADVSFTLLICCVERMNLNIRASQGNEQP